VAILARLACVEAPGQIPVDPESTRGGMLVKVFEEVLAARDTQKLGCSVSAVKPFLTVNLRYQAGYQVRFPLAGLDPRETRLLALVRVKPSQGGPRYFVQQFGFPRRPGRMPGRAEGSFYGGYYIGEGDYRTDFLMWDQSDRICRGGWDSRLKLREEDRADSRIPANTVEPLRIPRLAETRDRASRPYRVAVLLHAAPVHPLSSMFTQYDQSIILGTMHALLEQTPFVETSVTVFNLAQQKELFSTEVLSPRIFRQMTETLNQLQPGLVDIKVLSQKKGHIDLLASLVNRQIAAEKPPDALIFIGPNSIETDKFPPGLIENVPAKPLFFYLHRTPPFLSARFPFDDSIERLVKSQEGRVFEVHDAKQLRGALQTMEKMLAARRPAGP